MAITTRLELNEVGNEWELTLRLYNGDSIISTLAVIFFKKKPQINLHRQPFKALVAEIDDAIFWIDEFQDEDEKVRVTTVNDSYTKDLGNES